jgi:hypothetical protein
MATKYIFLCELWAIMSPGVGRISYAFLLLQIVPPDRPRRAILWFIICLQLVIDIGTVIISTVQCVPLSDFWEKGPTGNCWDPIIQQYTGYVQGCEWLARKRFIDQYAKPDRSDMFNCGLNTIALSREFILEPKHEAFHQDISFVVDGTRDIVSNPQCARTSEAADPDNDRM